MASKQLNYLPIKIEQKSALSLYQKVAAINKQIGFLNGELKHSSISDNFINIMSMHESLESTKI